MKFAKFGPAFVAVFAILAFSSFASAVNSTGLGGSLSLSALSYVPYPAEPGQYIDLFLNVYASESQYQVSCQLVPDFPFSLDSGDTAQRTIESIPGRQNWLLKYKVRVAPDAILGDNDLSFGCKTAAAPFIYSNFSIFVQSQSGNLAIDSVESTPEHMAPGQSALVSLSLRNFGGSEFKNVRVSLNLTDPFVPLKGGLEKRVERIGAGQTLPVVFEVLATQDAESKAYRVPVTIAFEDAAGTKYSIKDVVGLQVGAEPQLDVQLRTSTLLRANALGKVTLRLVNRGSEEIKYLTVRLLESPQYQSASQSQVYVGSVASDDFETLEMDVYARQVDPQLNVALEFRDSKNQLYQRTATIVVPTYTDEEISRFQLEAQPQTNWLLVIVALAILAYAARFAWLKWGKRK